MEQPWKCHTTFYQKFFTNKTTIEWNSLDSALKHSPSKSAFKRRLTLSNTKHPYLFNHNTDRQTQVNFMQIRMGFSNLKDHLFSKKCITDPICTCGAAREDTRHFFLKCPLYSDARKTMTDSISQQFNLKATLPTILYGSAK